MNEISFEDFLNVDFGEETGIRKSSAQITDYYDVSELEGRLAVGVVNFPPKQIGPVKSQCLVTGLHDEQGRVVKNNAKGQHLMLAIKA